MLGRKYKWVNVNHLTYHDLTACNESGILLTSSVVFFPLYTDFTAFVRLVIYGLKHFNIIKNVNTWHKELDNCNKTSIIHCTETLHFIYVNDENNPNTVHQQRKVINFV